MKKSALFEEGHYLKIQEMLKEFINNEQDFLSARTIASPRAVGDAIQSLLEDNFGKLLADYIGNYSANFARRAMADLAFTDKLSSHHERIHRQA
jgi:hypothetical protein